MISTRPNDSRKTILIPCTGEHEYRRTMQTLSRFRLVGSRVIVLADDGAEDLDQLVEHQTAKRMEPVPEPLATWQFAWAVGVLMGAATVASLWAVVEVMR